MPISRADVRRVMSENGPECPQYVFVWELQDKVTVPEASRRYLQQHKAKTLDSVPLDEIVREGRRLYVIKTISGCVYKGQLTRVPGLPTRGPEIRYRQGPEFSNGIEGTVRKAPKSGVSTISIKLFVLQENRAVSVSELLAHFRGQVNRLQVMNIYAKSLAGKSKEPKLRRGPAEGTDAYFERSLKHFFTTVAISAGRRTTNGWRYISKATPGPGGRSTLDSLLIPPGVRYSETKEE